MTRDNSHSSLSDALLIHVQNALFTGGESIAKTLLYLNQFNYGGFFDGKQILLARLDFCV